MSLKTRVLIGVLASSAVPALSGCVGVGVGYEGGGAAYDGGFYEPYGYEYGGWGPGYRVGPPGRDFRGGPGPRPGFHDGGGHPYHAPPAGHAMPSMPGRPRGR
jgi:hypothetical protein